MSSTRNKKTYDHRLRQLVRLTGDLSIATDLGVPRSTAAGWLHGASQDVITLDVLELREVELQAEVLKLRHRLRIVATIVSLLVLLVRIAGCSLDHQHNLGRHARAKIIKAIERAHGVLPLRIILRIMKLASSRFHAWNSDENSCRPAEGSHCPRRRPNQLTPHELGIMGDMVTSPDYRHVPTSRLALLAQRLGKVFASPSTWAKLVRQKGWPRPRLRIHPAQPTVGLRTSRPDEAWHKENFNAQVDELQTAGLLRRVRAQAEVVFSNSMIEAFWRTLNHQYLFMNRLDSVAAVRRHVAFYVKAHCTEGADELQEQQ